MGKKAGQSPLPSPALTPLAVTPATGEFHEKYWEDRPSFIKNNVIRKVCLTLLIAQAFDSTAGFALNQSLKLFFMKLGWSNAGSNSMKVTYDAISQFACITTGYVADEYLGKYKTIFSFAALDLAGFTLLVIASLPSVVGSVHIAKTLFTVGLFLGVALSHGALSWLFISFGGDQFSPTTQAKEKAIFFSVVFWFSSFGVTVSYAVFPTLSTKGLGAIPAKYGFTANYAFGLIALVVIVTALLYGRKRYVHLPPARSSVSRVIHAMFIHAKTNMRARLLVIGTLLFITAFAFNVLAALVADHGEMGHTVSKVAGLFVLIGMISWIYIGRDTSFMDSAKLTAGGKLDDQFVDDVKRIIRILPILSFNMIWYMCQNQRGNNQTIIQQTDVRLHNTPNSAQIPGPTIQGANPLSTLFYVPILERVFYPLYERKFGKPPSRYGRILVGYFLITLGMVWTGCFEIIRRNRPLLTFVAANGTTKFIYNQDGKQPMSDISWAAALPQYLINSLAGCFIYIPSYDLYYSEVPASMRATSMALGAFATSMGNTLLSAVILMWNKYVPANLNNGHMEYVHFTLAAMMAVNIVFYVIVMKETGVGMLPEVDKDEKAESTRTASVEEKA